MVLAGFEGSSRDSSVGAPVGALAVDLRFKSDRDYECAVKFLRMVAGIVAQAMRGDRLAEAETRRLVEENIHLGEQLRERYDFSYRVGSSSGMRQVYEQITQVVGTNTTALIRGESETEAGASAFATT